MFLSIPVGDTPDDGSALFSSNVMKEDKQKYPIHKDEMEDITGGRGEHYYSTMDEGSLLSTV